MLIIYVWKLGENLTKFIQLIVKVYMYVNIACNSKLNCETVKGKLKGKFQVSWSYPTDYWAQNFA